MISIARLAICLLGVFCVYSAIAQPFPAKPIRVIVPFAPGGSIDRLMRLLGSQITESTGQPVLVDNRPGGDTFIGMSACAKAAPDGYTLCATTADSLSANPHLFADVPYDATSDFVGVTQLVITYGVIAANAQMPFSTFKEMVQFAKAKPGALNFGTWGTGSAPNLYRQWINRKFGTDLVDVPYKGAAPAFTAVMSGEIQLTYVGLGNARPQLKQGKLKVLAVTGTKRTPFLPEVPSLGEEDVDPGLVNYFGLYAPAKTPSPIVDRLNAEFTKALRSTAIKNFVSGQSLEPVGNSVSEFNKIIPTDYEAMGRLLRTLGIRADTAPK